MYDTAHNEAITRVEILSHTINLNWKSHLEIGLFRVNVDS